MKRTNIHIFAAIALLFALAACTQDEAGFLPEGAEGTSIVFTATGLNPAATATVGTSYTFVKLSTHIFLNCESLLYSHAG